MTFRGQDVWYEGADIQWVGDPTSMSAELILIYKNTSGVNTFRTSVDAEARILAVGGGGAGGTARSVGYANHPGGGGGGAGELVDRSNVSLKKSDNTYTIIIGNGGPADGVSGKKSVGKPGEDSAITTAAGDFLRVKGGGGGGSESVGSDGGSGGGGAGNGIAGGQAVCHEADGQGHAGATSLKQYAGGGGGAGGDAPVVKDGAGGDGGAGFESNIWPDDDGKARFYAGGGGGGTTSGNKPGGKGGSGVGGNGGKYTASATAAGGESTPGAPNTGSGGGGGGVYTIGSAGGSGIIIIRLTYVEQPMVWKAIDVSAGGNEGKIFVDENAETSWIGTDLLITYNKANVRGGLRFFDPNDPSLPPVWANARVLVVGGGGGGGCITSRSGGAGGGGGAGGVVTGEGFVFDKSVEYSISVGAGGLGGGANEVAGGDGGDSFIKAGSDLLVDTALGGGGGGAHSAGHDGASGGGGSRTSTALEGGSGLQGHKGGDSGGTLGYAGGGGGAGSEGEAPVTTGTPHSGNGGAGLKNDITGEEKWYAGGGGGGYVDDSSVSYKRAGGVGGSGVGGNGSSTEGGIAVAATPGAPNTGSGGGGGISHTGADEKAGKGGDGVVIIRLSGFVVKGVPAPKANGPFTYDGVAHQGVDEFYAYEFTPESVAVAKNASTYTVVAKIKDTYPAMEWDDAEGGRGERMVTWTINRLSVQLPGATSNFVYNGAVQTPVDKTRFKVDAQGYAWVTSGTSGRDLKYCRLEDHEKTDADSYTVKASLVFVDQDDPSVVVTNFTWSAGGLTEKTYPWSITQYKQNQITGFYYPGYRRSRLSAHKPVDQFNVTFGKETTKTAYREDHGDGTYGEWTDWGDDGPATKGSYEVRVAIDETRNWNGTTNTLPFGTWEKWGDIFTDRMEITVSGNTSGATTLKDFPVPVRVHSPTNDGYEVFSGFTYARAGASGKELRFFDSNGDPVEHEVDTWNIYGESLLWVRVPALKTTTTKLTMCWRRVGDIRLPDYDPTRVWADYAGVWHFSQQESGSFWTDSSGHDLNAQLTAGGKVRTIDGKFGNGIYVDTGDLVVDGYNGLGNTTNFMFSGWYRNDQSTANNTAFAGTKMGTSGNSWNVQPGWSFFMNTATKVGMSAGNQWDGYDFGATIQSGFKHLAYVVPNNNANRYAYFNGANQRSRTGEIGLNERPLQLAGTKFSCDEVRLMKAAPANYATWAKEEYNSLNSANYCTYGIVRIDCDRYNDDDGLLCDWWVVSPSLAKTVWREGDSFPAEGKGQYKHAGSEITATYQLVPGGTPTAGRPTARGYYRAVYDHKAPGAYRSQPHVIDFYIIEPAPPTTDIGGQGGDSGRILLMNADTNVKGPVANQGWCVQSPEGTVTHWKTLTGGEGTNNVMPGTEFQLIRSADTNVLWHLVDCRQGNTFPTNDTAALSTALCYLPASRGTAMSITNESVKAARSGTGWVMMRNVPCPEQVVDEFASAVGACVYSPCYTNGIGTIYFDAVNARKAVASGTDKNDEGYQLVLEIATETTEELPPYDENCFTEDGQGHTNRYGRLEKMWRKVDMFPMVDGDGSYTTLNPVSTNCLALKMANGQKDSRFYRVHAPVSIHRPVRFRIRRVTRDEAARTAGGEVNPDDGFLLLDNVIVSFPPSSAELKPYGKFDPAQSGVAAVGYGGAFETPFPSAADGASLTGRCAVAFADEGTSLTAETFSLAQMRYRWRYLGQLREPKPASGEDWKVATLEQAEGELRTAAPLETPAEPGDIEFYFVTVMKSPYYAYVDYTGLNVPVWPADKGGYTEEGMPYSDRYEPRDDADVLATGGRDWYVRLRDGRSRYEGVRLLTRPAGGGAVETNDFELAGDDQWTVKLRTRHPVAAGLEFRIEGRNPQTPGAKEYAFSTDRWTADERIEKFPAVNVGVSPCGADQWGRVACDAATGWLYFQLDLEKTRLQVAHAEAENFARWSSALSADGRFVGSAVDTNASSAVTSEALVDWGKWSATPAGNTNWNESFTAPAGVVTTGLYPRNEPFSTARSQFGWTAESAMWTYGQWSRQNNADATKSTGDDSAVQLMGLGQGRLSFIDASNVPDGLDTVTFRARVGQVNDFNDFAHYDGYFGTSFDDMEPMKLMSNYTVATIAALTETGAASYDGDGSISLIGYYNDQFGCYEFRVSRGTTDKDIRLALFRWRKVGAGYVCEKLLDENSDAKKRKNYFDYNTANMNADRLVKMSKTQFGGLFLSVMEDGGKTLVTAGVREGDVSTLSGTESMSGQAFTCITYHDNSADRLTKGTFGLTSCNCPAIFAKPILYRAGVQAYKPSKAGYLQGATGKTITFSGDEVSGADNDKYYTWWARLGRLVRLTGHDCWGFAASSPEAQTLKVQISEHGKSDWKDVYANTVSGFTGQSFQNVIHDPRTCDVRLQVGEATSSARTDIIVDEVALTQWNGQWTPNWDQSAAPHRYLTNEFVYTSAWVVDRSGRRSLKLQPSRAKTATTPVSLRSPLMRGLGLVFFKWRDADPHAKIRVQYKENVTYGNVKNATETQTSAATEVGNGWVDFETIPVGEIGASGSKAVYINRRYDGWDDGIDYYRGMVRLIVDKDVQDYALSGDRRRTEPNYGSVEITDAFVWDFPEYDKSGWQGWNFRAAGWNGAEPDEFANLKDSFNGLSGLLNNTLDEGTLADREKGHYSQNLPHVQSPVFQTNCVGAISFRARLYDADDLDKTGHGAVVTVYGCNSFDDKGEPTGEWKEIGDVEISNRTYAVCSMKIPATLDCKAIRLAVKGVKGVTAAGTPKYDPPLRVALDDIVIWERLAQSVAFRRSYVRPFRDAQAIKGTEVVKDIAAMAEQPLVGEAFGFQAEVEVLDPDEVIVGDPDYPITVDLWYYAGSDVWGFENWKTNPAVVKVTGLKPATDGNGLVFRSTVEQSASLCPPQFLNAGEGYRIVQYHLTAHYFVQGHSEGVHELQSSEWSMPAWNTGFEDPNAKHAAFSAFTLLEEIAPGRAWINEINYCEPLKDDSLANQYIELAVPSGVDMTDWTLTAYGWDGTEIGKLATLGRKLMPASKTYRGSDPVALASHYAFYTLKGPKTTTLPVDGKWDGTWTVNNALEYNRPYAFELRRPTGVVEHRVVAQGWNQARDEGYWYAFRYDGTNTVEVMRQKDGADWTWSAEDYHDAASKGCSVSVVTNQGAQHTDWVSPLQKTPGDINRGQYIAPDWFVLPNGGYVKIYANVIGEHMRQIIGNVTNTVGDMTISQGNSTSIVYEVDRWYQLGNRSVTPDERATWSGPTVKDGKSYYTLSLNLVSNRMDIVVAATNADEVTALIDPKYAAYTPAIMRWLETGTTGWGDGGTHPFKNPNGPLQVGWYRGNSFENPLPIDQEATYSNKLDLVHLYWFDLDPTAGGWELWGGMGSRPGSNVQLPVDTTVMRTKELYGGGELIHTNHLTSFWMELKNAGLGLDYPPYRLQGLKNEQSDSWGNVWTSATFKVTMCLNNGKVNWVFQPMRYFVFGRDSFYPANHEETPFAAQVEITDPFSNQSPASEWGWKKYESMEMRENGLFTRWRIDGRITPDGVETLKKDDLLEF